MRLPIICFFLSLLNCSVVSSQYIEEDLKYLGQKAPGMQPEVFAPGLISLEDHYEFGSVFNRAGTAFYYGVELGNRTEVRYSELKEGEWSTPVTILSHPEYGFNDPFLSPDEQRLYFISRRSVTGSGAKEDYDIWYVEKRRDTWSAPFNPGPNINSTADEYYISFTQDGTMYFASDKRSSGENYSSHDIYYSKNVNGEFQPPVKLGNAINTPDYEADVFVAPDESYVIFCSTRMEGMGRGDLYVSFRKEDGNWTESVNMGDKINTKGHELCPFVSSDGKYFFFTSNQDIYWVDAGILDELRKEE